LLPLRSAPPPPPLERPPDRDIPIPGIDLTNHEAAAIFRPGFRPQLFKVPRQPEAERLLNEAESLPKTAVDSPNRDAAGAESSSSDPVDQDMIQKLLADVDISD
jgi:hypothetical protein